MLKSKLEECTSLYFLAGSILEGKNVLHFLTVFTKDRFKKFEIIVNRKRMKTLSVAIVIPETLYGAISSRQFSRRYLTFVDRWLPRI